MRHETKHALTVLALTAMLAFAGSVLAATAGYNTSTPGNWTTSANWSTNVGATPYTPVTGDTLHIGSTQYAPFSGTATVTMDAGATFDGASLELGYNAGNSGTLIVDGAATSLRMDAVVIGRSGTGALSLTNGASLIVDTGMYMNYSAASGSSISAASGAKITFNYNAGGVFYLRNGASFNVPNGVIQLNGSSRHLNSVTLDSGASSFTQNQDLIANSAITLTAPGSTWTLSGAYRLEHLSNLVLSGAGTSLDATAAGATIDSDATNAHIYLRDGGTLAHNAGTFDVGSGDRIRNLTMDIGNASWTQQDPDFAILGNLTMTTSGTPTYTVGAGNKLVVSGLINLTSPNAVLDASAAGAKIQNDGASAHIYLRPGATLSFSPGTFDTGAGARVRNLTIADTAGSASFTQQDSSFTVLGQLTLGNGSTGAGTYTVGAGNTLALNSTALVYGPGCLLDASGAGAKINAWVSGNSHVRVLYGSVNYNAGTFDVGSGARCYTLTVARGSSWTQKDSVFDVVTMQLGENAAPYTGAYTISAGQTFNTYLGNAGGLNLYYDDGNEFRGAGTVNLNRTTTSGGSFQEGQIIADGGGANATLLFTRPNTTPVFSFPVENPPTGITGWYAVNKGRLELPSLAVTGADVTWGDTATDTTPDFVNSAAFLNWTNAVGAGTLDVALLAPDRSEVPSGLVSLVNPVGAWDISLSGMTFDDVDVTFRYDAVAAGVNESLLKIFQASGGTWTLVPFTLDTVNKTITAPNVTSFSYFAVARDLSIVPEPSVAALLALAGLILGRTTNKRDEG